MNEKNSRSTRRRMLGIIVCISVALVIVTLMLMAVFSRREKTLPPTEGDNVTDISEDTVVTTEEVIEDVIEAPEAVTEPAAVTEAEEAEPVVVVPKQTEPETTAPPTVSPEPKPLTPTFTAPLDGVVTKTHSEDMLVYSVTMNDYRVHLGIDIAADIGSPVIACADGVITEVSNDPFMGGTVTIDHGNGYTSTCQSLSSTFAEGIEVGASVTQGTLIGAVSDSAVIEIADRPHLHFELTKDGMHVDPLDFMEFDTAEQYGE